MTDFLWTADELAAATGGRWHGNIQGITGLTNDSRTATAGDLFIALAGVRDGHDFIPKAAKQGAAAALVTHVTDNELPQLVVPDTTAALRTLGVAARNRAPAKRAAVTGSVGKTGVTRAILAGLTAAGRAHGPIGSFNNHIGVPLTLSRMPRDTQRAVFEVGMNHAGEIADLTPLIAPHVAVITTIGAVHTEHFPTGEEGVAEAKAEIFTGLAPNGLAVLNRDNKWYNLLHDRAAAAGARITSFGEHADATLRLMNAKPFDDGLLVTARDKEKDFTFTLQQSGRHWAMNALAVLLALDGMDVSRDIAIAALQNYAPQDGRGASHTVSIGNGTYRLIDDAYNANPTSMRAALTTLGEAPATRRIAVMTDMLELGPDAPAWHAGLAADIDAAGIDLAFGAGPLMKNLYDALPAARRGGYAATAAELAPMVKEALKPGDVVMVKGSKGSKAAAIVEFLLKA